MRDNYSTSYALINLTKTIKQSLDQDLFSCGIFVDRLLGKSEHYGTRGITNKWFETDRQQFVSINDYNAECALVLTGVPQQFVLGPLLLLLYINDLKLAIKHCKAHHFADDTSLLYANNSLKNLNKLLNIDDLKNLTDWLNA